MRNFIKSKLGIFFSLVFICIFIILTLYICNYFFKYKKLKKDIKESIYHQVSFENISFLKKDINLIDFIKPFQESCRVFNKKNSNIVTINQPYTVKIKDWQNVCNLFNQTKINTNEDIINFIKENFNIYIIKGENKAKITGYYRMKLEGSLKKDSEFKYPIYKIPSDLITVNLSNFSNDLKNIQIFGRLFNNNLIPYYSRAEINKGVLENKNLELVWLNNKYSAFLLHIQGSGLIKIKDDNKVMYLSYDGRNGHPFKGIYTYMKEKGYIRSTKLKGLDYFYDFFDKNPDKIDEVLNNNPSYIFFKEVNKEAWYGAFGTNPYAERTIAVDPKYISLGTPVLVKMNHPNAKNLNISNTSTNNEYTSNTSTISTKNVKNSDKEIVRLVVANDIGSAIKGVARIDFYWGIGDEAGYNASITNQKGSLYLFLPKNTANKE